MQRATARRQQQRWTPAQARAFREFVERADSASDYPPTANELALRIMVELGPGVIGRRSKNAVRQRIWLIRAGDFSEEPSSASVWAPAHRLALGEFVQREELATRTMGMDPLSTNELVRRAMAQMDPAVLSQRSKEALRFQIQSIRAQGNN